MSESNDVKCPRCGRAGVLYDYKPANPMDRAGSRWVAYVCHSDPAGACQLTREQRGAVKQ